MKLSTTSYCHYVSNVLIMFIQTCEYFSVPACAMKVATGAALTSVYTLFCMCKTEVSTAPIATFTFIAQAGTLRYSQDYLHKHYDNYTVRTSSISLGEYCYNLLLYMYSLLMVLCKYHLTLQSM